MKFYGIQSKKSFGTWEYKERQYWKFSALRLERIMTNLWTVSAGIAMATWKYGKCYKIMNHNLAFIVLLPFYGDWRVVFHSSSSFIVSASLSFDVNFHPEPKMEFISHGWMNQILLRKLINHCIAQSDSEIPLDFKTTFWVQQTYMIWSGPSKIIHLLPYSLHLMMNVPTLWWRFRPYDERFQQTTDNLSQFFKA